MTSLRRTIFLLFAGCVVFAVGVALGGGPLQGDSANVGGDPTSADGARNDRIAALENAQVFSAAVSAATAPSQLRGVLDGAAVTLLALPDVDEGVVSGMQEAVTGAGGVPVVTAHISVDYVDSSKKAYVDSVARSSMRGLVDLAPLADAEPYTRIAALMARAYVGHEDDLTVDEEATRIDSELQGAKLLQVDGDLRRRGSLVVLLAPGGHSADDETHAAHLIQAELVTGLARAGDGVVVVTPPTASLPGGFLADLEEVSLAGLPVSTLNVQAGIDARIAAVHAVAGAANGRPGDFGVDGSDVVLPPGLADPAR